MPTPRDIQAFNDSVVEEFRANNGQVKHERVRDVPLVLLTSVGARSGKPHTTPLAYFSDGPGRIVVWASAMAAPEHPDWYRNLVANPRVTIELRSARGTVECFAAMASTTQGKERDRLLGSLRSTRPDIAAHQDQTTREIPLVVIDYQQ